MASLEDLVSPAEAPTRELIDAIVNRRVQEGFTLEYKRELSDGGANVLKAVAAMANTFGGAVLVGVDEDRTNGQAFGFPGRIIGVDPEDRSRLVSWCVAHLVPPLATEVSSVEIDGGKVVLVVRVRTEGVRRPVMFKHQVLVRTDDGNVPADWFRLEELFRMPSGTDQAGGGYTVYPVEHSPVWSEDPPPDLFVRLVAGFPALAGGRRLRIEDPARDALCRALSEAPLEGWLLDHLHGNGLNPWHPEGHSTTTNLQLRWQGVVERHGNYSPEAHCTVALPTVGSGTMTCALDVILRPTLVQKLANERGDRAAPKFRLGLDELLTLLRALLDTYVVAIAQRASEIARAPTPGPVGLTCHVISRGRPINEALQLDALPLVAGNEPGQGATLYPDAGTRLDEATSREHLAGEWLRQFLQDCHYRHVDQTVDAIEARLEGVSAASKRS